MENKLLDRVDDGFNYFLDFRLEEVKTDDKYYIEAFMQYIDVLECKVDKLSKQLKWVKEHFYKESKYK